MALPIEISPNPLIRSTVEISFSAKIERAKLFSAVYPPFASTFPIFEENKIPKGIRNLRSELKFSPDYILRNDDFTLSFGANSISFENVSEYKFWSVYFPFIKQQLETFFGLNIIDKINRIGLRYASVFGNGKKINDILQLSTDVRTEGYQQSFVSMTNNYKMGDYNFRVHLADNVQLIKNNKPLSGAYIDIDGSFKGELQPSSNIFNVIDEIHTEGKNLFFLKLLRPSFLATLNPKYS